MAVERDDSFAEALYNLGFALSRIGKYDEALEATKKAMEIDPYYSSNRFKLGVDIFSERLGILVARELTKDMEVGRVAGEETAEDFFGDLFEAPEEEIKPKEKNAIATGSFSNICGKSVTSILNFSRSF